MERLAGLLVLFFTCCAGAPQDMTGKQIIFPTESDTAHVRIAADPEKASFAAVTVCGRFFTDYAAKEQCLFSLATPIHADAFAIFRGALRYALYVGDTRVYFWGLADEMKSDWNSVCATWESRGGMSQLWLNGKPSARKAVQDGYSIAGTPSIVLGQNQDNYGGGFGAFNSFYGHQTDVHMWDRVLSPCEIQSYTRYGSYAPGNVVNWGALDYAAAGYVVIEREQKYKSCGY